MRSSLLFLLLAIISLCDAYGIFDNYRTDKFYTYSDKLITDPKCAILRTDWSWYSEMFKRYVDNVETIKEYNGNYTITNSNKEVVSEEECNYIFCDDPTIGNHCSGQNITQADCFVIFDEDEKVLYKDYPVVNKTRYLYTCDSDMFNNFARRSEEDQKSNPCNFKNGVLTCTCKSCDITIFNTGTEIHKHCDENLVLYLCDKYTAHERILLYIQIVSNNYDDIFTLHNEITDENPYLTCKSYNYFKPSINPDCYTVIQYIISGIIYLGIAIAIILILILIIKIVKCLPRHNYNHLVNDKDDDEEMQNLNKQSPKEKAPKLSGKQLTENKASLLPAVESTSSEEDVNNTSFEEDDVFVDEDEYQGVENNTVKINDVLQKDALEIMQEIDSHKMDNKVQKEKEKEKEQEKSLFKNPFKAYKAKRTVNSSTTRKAQSKPKVKPSLNNALLFINYAFSSLLIICFLLAKLPLVKAELCNGSGISIDSYDCLDFGNSQVCETNMRSSFSLYGKRDGACWSVEKNGVVARVNVESMNNYILFPLKALYFSPTFEYIGECKLNKYHPYTGCGCGYFGNSDSWNHYTTEPRDNDYCIKNEPGAYHCCCSDSFWYCYDRYTSWHVGNYHIWYTVYEPANPIYCVDLKVSYLRQENSTSYPTTICSENYDYNNEGVSIRYTGSTSVPTPKLNLIKNNHNGKFYILEDTIVSQKNDAKKTRFGTLQFEKIGDTNPDQWPTDLFYKDMFACSNDNAHSYVKNGQGNYLMFNSMDNYIQTTYNNGTILVVNDPFTTNGTQPYLKYYYGNSMQFNFDLEVRNMKFKSTTSTQYSCTKFNLSCDVIDGVNSRTNVTYSCSCNNDRVPLYTLVNNTRAMVDYLSCDEKEHTFLSHYLINSQFELGGMMLNTNCSYYLNLQLSNHSDYSKLVTMYNVANENDNYWWYLIILCAIIALVFFVMLIVIKKCCCP